jgi:hypothetical protein
MPQSSKKMTPTESGVIGGRRQGDGAKLPQPRGSRMSGA